MNIEVMTLLQEMDGRLKKIEGLLLGGTAPKKLPADLGAKLQGDPAKKYSGLTGGVFFLIDRGYFASPKTAAEVIDELGREGYHHESATVRKTLGAYFTRNKKLLTRIKEEGVYKYAIRK